MDENTHTENEAPIEAGQDTETGSETSAFDQELDDAVTGALDAIEDAPEGWYDDDEIDDAGESGDEGSDAGAEVDHTGDGENTDDSDSGSDTAVQDNADDAKVENTPTIDRDAAIDALIASGMKPADVMKLTPDELLRQGAEKLAEIEDAGDQDAGDEAKPDDQEDQSEISDEEYMKAISEELGEDFSMKEQERIGKAIAKAVDLRRAPKFDFSPYVKSFNERIDEVKGLARLVQVMSGEVERLSVASARAQLKEAFPQLDDQANFDRVLKRAEKYTSKSDSLAEAIEIAAFAEFGREQTQMIQKHDRKVKRAKQSGKPTRRASVARDPQKDEITLAAEKAVEDHLDK